MAHAVSLTYARFDHMSPTAVALTTLLHAAVVAALWWVSPLNRIDHRDDDAIAITMERELPTPETPQQPVPPPDPPPRPQAAAPPPAPPPAPPMRLGLTPSGPSRDPKATPGVEQPSPPKPETPAEEPANQEATKAEPPKEEQQQALAVPPPPPPPPPALEKVLPPVEAPPPPLTSREIPRPAPPPPAPKPPPPPQPPQRVQPAPRPAPPQQALQSSPLSNVPQRPMPGDQQASRLVNPADALGQRRAEDEYLWYVARKISQHQEFVRNATTEAGTVVLRLTIARDGRLVDVGLSRSSGLASLDGVSLNMIRQAAPYPPLPPDFTGAQHTFTLPLYFKRN